MTDVTVLREVADSARLGKDIYVGPYCVIGPDVSIGRATRLESRVTIVGKTTVGQLNVFEEGCVLGCSPQDLKYTGEPAELVIGDRNRFGRFATAHIGTAGGGNLTLIGSNNVLENGSHVAHDCYVDDKVRLGRYVLLAGHVRIECGVVMDDFSAAHHFTTIGRHSRVRPYTPIRRDVPPYTDFFSANPDRQPASVGGIHDEGVRSANLALLEELDLRQALRELFTDESALQTKIEHLMNLGVEGEVARLCEFCRRSLHGIYGRHRETLRGQAPPESLTFFARRDTVQTSKREEI